MSLDPMLASTAAFTGVVPRGAVATAATPVLLPVIQAHVDDQVLMLETDTLNDHVLHAE